MILPSVAHPPPWLSRTIGAIQRRASRRDRTGISAPRMIGWTPALPPQRRQHLLDSRELEPGPAARLAPFLLQLVEPLPVLPRDQAHFPVGQQPLHGSALRPGRLVEPA